MEQVTVHGGRSVSTPALGAQASTLFREGRKLAKSCNPSIHQGNWEPWATGKEDRVRAVGRNSCCSGAGTVFCCLGVTG